MGIPVGRIQTTIWSLAAVLKLHRHPSSGAGVLGLPIGVPSASASSCGR